MDTLSSLGEKMDNNFKKLTEEMEIFKQDLKAEVQVLRNTVSELETAAQTVFVLNRISRGEQQVAVAVTSLSSKRN